MKHNLGKWLDVAERLPVGSKCKTLCDSGCGNSASQLVSHSQNGYSRHCFRCGEHEFKPHGQRRLSDLIRHQLEYKMINDKVVALPDDYTLDVPQHAMMWYVKVGISPDLARDHGIGYSPSLDRVVLPVYNRATGTLDAVQMRSVDKNRKPKYLNPQGANVSRALFEVGESKGAVVVVEDILSAIKVGRVVPTASILGTSLTDERALRLARDNSIVILWLDADGAGYSGTRKAVKKLKMLGVRVYRVDSPLDPKAYNMGEIEDKLKGIIECHK